ncbi:hypothetical protein QBC41DRAFT_331458 [Cercophora samala]|uniref:Uncharacterized protein n=1 Tax=Cercophora samala TaxID=330535 RepID=A0AA40D1P8_9PEZI|nr:hypothetical protein QBC41DRAFT_331458 [Cercophora samala]
MDFTKSTSAHRRATSDVSWLKTTFLELATLCFVLLITHWHLKKFGIYFQSTFGELGMVVWINGLLGDITAGKVFSAFKVDPIVDGKRALVPVADFFLIFVLLAALQRLWTEIPVVLGASLVAIVCFFLYDDYRMEQMELAKQERQEEISAYRQVVRQFERERWSMEG